MRLYLITGLAVSLLFIIFLLQNTSVVYTHFIIWKFSGSLAITTLISFAMGVIVSLLIAIPLVFKRKKTQAPIDKTD